MVTIVHFTKAFGTTKSTIRNWSAEFADHLSPAANPPQGEARQFDAHDCQVMALVAEMRSKHAGYAEIHAALAAGERGQWPPPGFTHEEEGEGDAPTSQLTTQLTIQLAQTEGQLKAIGQERDHLRAQLDAAQTARMDAEIRAARAEATLQAIVTPPTTPTPPSAPPTLAEALRSWWGGRKA